jgi:hypothetical protein
MISPLNFLVLGVATGTIEHESEAPRPMVGKQSSTTLSHDHSSSVLHQLSHKIVLPSTTTRRFPVMLDHDETSTIATTFTTPISYVEFNNEGPAKLHSPNDSHLDHMTKLLVVDLQSTEASTVQTTDAAIIVQMQSALPILIALRR